MYVLRATMSITRSRVDSRTLLPVFVLTESCPRVEGARGLDVARLLQPEECSSSRLLVFEPSAHLGFAKGKLIHACRPPLCSPVDSTLDGNCSLELFSSLGRRHAALPTIVGTLCLPIILQLKCQYT